MTLVARARSLALSLPLRPRWAAVARLGLIASAAAGLVTACKRSDPPGSAEVTPSSSLATATAPASGRAMVAESLPRCRVEGARLALPGDDTVTGDAAASADALFVGAIRREGTRRIASVVRAPLDLASLKVIDLGTALGEDPPPSPRMRGGFAFVASYARARAGADAGAGAGAGAPGGGADAGVGAGLTRVLDVGRLEGDAVVSLGSVAQQADESLAYDVAWPLDADKAAPLVAWDEDAPPRAGAFLSDRGVIKVQVLRSGGSGSAVDGGAGRARIASPDTSDAEAPRLLARRGGYWLAWLARRPEVVEDAGPNGALEGPGERRAYRWVELVALDLRGEPKSPVRRVSPEKGRVASFDLAAGEPSPGHDAQLVLLVQDEAAHSEGAGERLVRYAINGDAVESADLLDGGIGHGLAELLPAAGDGGAGRWLVFSDAQEHAHLVPLGTTLRLTAPATAEPSLDGARIVASAPPDVLYAIGAATSANGSANGSPAGSTKASLGGAAAGVELRRLICR